MNKKTGTLLRIIGYILLVLSFFDFFTMIWLNVILKDEYNWITLLFLLPIITFCAALLMLTVGEIQKEQNQMIQELININIKLQNCVNAIQYQQSQQMQQAQYFQQMQNIPTQIMPNINNKSTGNS
jgi:uncharacterized membrane protein